MRRRKTIPPDTVTRVLTRCRRRCCLCFFYEDDLAIQKGQIAHLDRDPANSDEDNLAFLCQRHHDEYDSRTSQTRGLTIGEVKYARDQLYKTLHKETDDADVESGGGVAVVTGLQEIELTLPCEFESFTDAEQEKLLRSIGELLAIRDIKVINKRLGSVKITLGMAPDEAERLFWATKAGDLAAIGVTDARLIHCDDPRSTHVGCPEPAELAEYAHNDAAPKDAAALDEHLVNCRACLEHYLELGAQPLAPQIPNCRIVKEIGRGRFGVVYKAWWLEDKPRIVALKVLTCPGDMERSRFEREIAVLKRIDSPSVVKCIDSGVSGEALYYVMDFVEGETLDEYLACSVGDLNEKLKLFQRVCRAVADAHAQGVIHRDLKPRNILIDADGQPHIVDFGICAVETADWSSWARCTITRAGDVIGTLKYMSPEQAWGGVAGPIDERSDIWALGVMLYEIVTDGGYPYDIEPTPDKPVHEALLERIRRKLPRLPRLDTIPRGRNLRTLLERCLAWEPDRRIESAAKLADDLERHCDGRRIKTKPLWIPYRLKRLAVGAATRSRWAFTAAFVATLGMTLSLAVLLLNVGWHVTGHHYQGQSNKSAAMTGPSRGHVDIVVVGVFDDTVDAVVDFATGERIDNVTDHITTWRAVHGRLMERLATASPRAVVWDYFFRTPQPGDARLVAGIESLEDAGVPVILAARNYHEDGAPDLSPHITGPLSKRLRHGVITARDMVKRPREFVMAIRRGEHSVVPNLALTTLAAVLHPQARLDIDWPGRNRPISLLYEIQPGAYLRERDRLGLTKVFKSGRTEHSVRAGDLVACTTFDLDPPKRWEERTIPYQTLLTAPDEKLIELVSDKLLVVGDLRAPRFGFSGDRHRVKYGTTIINDVPGCYLLADAIAGLLDRRYMKSTSLLPPATLLPMMLIAFVGCLLPIKLAKRREFERPHHRHLLWITLLTLSASSFLVMILSESCVAVHLGMVGFALLTPMTGSFWIEFVRNRHRIADKQRRGIDSFGLASSRTITLASKPWKSPPTAGSRR